MLKSLKEWSARRKINRLMKLIERSGGDVEVRTTPGVADYDHVQSQLNELAAQLRAICDHLGISVLKQHGYKVVERDKRFGEIGMVRDEVSGSSVSSKKGDK